MNKDEKPIPSFLTDGAKRATLMDVSNAEPVGNGYPTEAQKIAYPKESLAYIEAANQRLQRDLNASIVRETDLRDALCNAVAAMESAQNLSVSMARKELDNCGRASSHMAIQNLLDLSLFHIEETTGINARGAA